MAVGSFLSGLSPHENDASAHLQAACQFFDGAMSGAFVHNDDAGRDARTCVPSSADRWAAALSWVLQVTPAGMAHVALAFSQCRLVFSDGPQPMLQRGSPRTAG